MSEKNSNTLPPMEVLADLLRDGESKTKRKMSLYYFLNQEPDPLTDHSSKLYSSESPHRGGSSEPPYDATMNHPASVDVKHGDSLDLSYLIRATEYEEELNLKYQKDEIPDDKDSFHLPPKHLSNLMHKYSTPLPLQQQPSNKSFEKKTSMAISPHKAKYISDHYKKPERQSFVHPYYSLDDATLAEQGILVAKSKKQPVKRTQYPFTNTNPTNYSSPVDPIPPPSHVRSRNGLSGSLTNLSLPNFCICHQLKDPYPSSLTAAHQEDFILDCHHCKKYYHGNCVHMDSKSIEWYERWCCPNCIGSGFKSIKRKACLFVGCKNPILVENSNYEGYCKLECLKKATIMRNMNHSILRNNNKNTIINSMPLNTSLPLSSKLTSSNGSENGPNGSIPRKNNYHHLYNKIYYNHSKKKV